MGQSTLVSRLMQHGWLEGLLQPPKLMHGSSSQPTTCLTVCRRRSPFFSPSYPRRSTVPTTAEASRRRPCRRHPCAMKPKARPLTSSAVPPRDAAALPSTRATGVYACSVRRGGRARAPARRRGGTSVSLSSQPARRRRAWWLSQRKPVVRVSSLQTGCRCGIYLRDLESHMDPTI